VRDACAPGQGGTTEIQARVRVIGLSGHRNLRPRVFATGTPKRNDRRLHADRQIGGESSVFTRDARDTRRITTCPAGYRSSSFDILKIARR